MDDLKLTNRKSEKGFTLVELAVVMIIIGLLIGGVLKGQELITNARLTTTTSQLEGVGAAYNGFLDKYNVQAGDMGNAATRLADCANFAACADAATPNGVIDANVGSAQGANESTQFWGQLLASGFISGMTGSDTGAAAQFGVTSPSAPIGGGFTIGDARVGQAAGFTQTLRNRPYVVLTDSIAALATGDGPLTADQASSVDTRLDDGNPQTGTVVGHDVAADCVTTVGDATYTGAAQPCSVAYRL